MNNKKYLLVAVTAAKAAGPVFKKYFGRPKQVEKKNGNRLDLVTEVDKKIESGIKKILGKNFPNHSILGEESGLNEHANLKNCVWVIDPIDGTTNYIQGIPECAISIAMWDKHGPQVAVIYNPITNLLYAAQKNNGAFLNGKKIRVSTTKNMTDAYCAIGWNESVDKNSAELFMTVKNLSRKIRVFATSALQLAYVSSGNLDFYAVKGIKAWDFAAGLLLIKEAGGKVTEWDGKPASLQSQKLIASNGKLHSEVVKKLQ